MSVTSKTWRFPKAREAEASFGPSTSAAGKTSSPTKTYFPWRQAVWVPRMNPGPCRSSTSRYSSFRSYLTQLTSCGFEGLPPLIPAPMSRITSPSFQ
jgi:hypothetical protein